MNVKSFILSVVLGAIASFSCWAETQLHITTGFTPPVSDLFNRVLTEADKRMTNVSISFEVLPTERSLILVNQGINDAECCRVPAILTKQYKNLAAINVSFFTARFSTFSKNTAREIRTFNDLKPYSVGSVKGWKLAVN